MSMWELLIGDYDWGFLCMPRVPWGERKLPPPLFGRDEPISLFVSFVMGAQHALAMVGGIITVPLIIGGQFYGNFTTDEQHYIISAALIVSGIASFVQVTQIPIPFTNYKIGSGLLSVMGISFTFLPIAESAIGTMRTCSCDGIPCSTGTGGTCDACTGSLAGSCLTGQEAYGKVLGTVCVCCFVEILLSFAPPKVLRRLFPPVVSGTTVILIGFALVSTGFSYWGGGVYCGEQVLTSKVLCNTNGNVELPFGAKQYIGLGFSVFITLVFVEMFGSPFLRNVQVAIGLLVGMIVASATQLTQCTDTCISPTCPCFDILPGGVTYSNSTNTISGTPNGTTYGNSSICLSNCGDPTCTTACVANRYVTSKQIDSAKWVTFLWVKTFPLGFYAPAVLPMVFGFMVTTMECIGDVTATTEASGLIPVGEQYEQSVQGGVLADGLNCLWAALATQLPCTTYAQNNGVISLTRCGARRAGWACAIILFTLGIVSKFAGIILTIPDCVLGGMTTFLFINVSVSGMKILTMGEGITRRNRFISAMAMALGVGVSLVPAWVNISGQFEYPNEGNLWPINPTWSSGYRGFRDALIIVLSTGFSIGGFTALVLNLVIPYDLEELEEPKEGGGGDGEKLTPYHEA
eukprot:TRINITY_DN9731_c0_g1_i1.p1 TRINITY_DN9731_c0_g1~~TRINITY_DN9731_c0_g1_i1.p1  ORF type:complete len:633 (+),score=99.93 TRINITY_DN9731_c0_g1_i1:213-2111(+)